MRTEPLDRDRWNALASGFADHSYRQLWDFGVHAAARVGAVSEHVGLTDGGDVVALADVRVRRLPVVGGGIAYVNGGPLTRLGGTCDPARYLAAVEALRGEYSERRGLVLRVTAPLGPAEWSDAVRSGLADLGFAPTAVRRGYRTFVLPVSDELPAIRKRFHQKWRNCLNRSEREGISVSTATDDASFDRFTAFCEEFVERKGVRLGLSPRFYREVQRALPERDRFVVLFAERGGELLAGHVSSRLGDTSVYLLGATSPPGLAAKAAYLLQWHAISGAKEAGCANYDLGGIDPVAGPGVHHFKEGLGGEDVSTVGPVEWGRGLRSRAALALEARYLASKAGADAPARPE